MVKRDGLTQTWASFNLPTVLQANVGGSTYQSQFSYGPDHKRWRQIGTYLNGTETTHYVGGLLEKVNATSTGVTYWRHYVPTPSGLTAIVSRNSNNSTWTTFALSDHLGSSDALLNGSGALVTRESFDAFGARRGSNWSTSTPPDWAGIADTTRRGYTFHEMLDNINLIHMNGRVYEPAIGRFLSVDPLVSDLADSQSVNPYAYVGNRPLSFTDPSGYFNDPYHNYDRRNGSPPIANLPSYGHRVDVDLRGFARLLSDVADFFGDLFSLDNALPPLARSFPGTSGQNGVNMCDSGMSSASCSGTYGGPLSFGVAGGDVTGVSAGIAAPARQSFLYLLVFGGQQQGTGATVQGPDLEKIPNVYDSNEFGYAPLRPAITDFIRSLSDSKYDPRSITDALQRLLGELDVALAGTFDDAGTGQLEAAREEVNDALESFEHSPPDDSDLPAGNFVPNEPGNILPIDDPKSRERFKIKYDCMEKARCAMQ